MNFSIEEDLPIILLKEYELNFHIKGYHVYMMKWNPTLGEFLKAPLEPENEFEKICNFSQKMRCCGWTFIKNEIWSIRKHNFIFSSWKQWKRLQSWSYWEKSEPLQWGRTCKIDWQVKRYFTDMIINISFLFYFLPFLDHKRTNVRFNKHIFILGIENIVRISECSNYRCSN